LSSPQLVFMMVLKCDKTMSAKEIQEQFGILDIDFDGFLEPLINNGFLIAMLDSCYCITEKGIETLGKLWTIVENTEKAILSGFTEDEKDILFNMLDRIKNNSIDLL